MFTELAQPEQSKWITLQKEIKSHKGYRGSNNGHKLLKDQKWHQSKVTKRAKLIKFCQTFTLQRPKRPSNCTKSVKCL